MYLSKNASGTYYTRLPLPKSLRDLGLPFAIRTSLCTKDRQLAVDRNLAVAARTRVLIAATPADTPPPQFLLLELYGSKWLFRIAAHRKKGSWSSLCGIISRQAKQATPKRRS